MLQILMLLSVAIVVFGILLQLRLSALGLSPIKFDLPDLPDLPTLVADDRLANAIVEKIGEGELLYPESLAAAPDGRCAFISLGDGQIMRSTSQDHLSWYPVLRTGGPRIIRKMKNGKNTRDDRACGKGGPADENKMEPRCGRPLGLWMSRRASVDPDFISVASPRRNNYTVPNPPKDEDVLLVADAYKGFLMVTGIYGFNGAEMHTLATRAKTDPPDYKFALLNAVVQIPNGDIYLTETSQKFQRRRIFHAFMDGAPTGRLLRYRRDEGGVVEVMAENIFMANGIALSHDGKSLVIVSGVTILRFDLTTEKMDPMPFVEVMPGTGDNIKTMDQLPNGKKMKCYWAALGGKYIKPFSLPKFLSDKPWIRSLILALTPYRKLIDLIPKWTALVVYDQRGRLVDFLKINENGKKTVTAPWISEMEPMGDYLYLLSWYNPFLARIKKSSIGKQEP